MSLVSGRETKLHRLQQPETKLHAMACRLEDQLIVFMALAEGKSNMTCGPPSLHTRTAMVVAEKLTGAKFSVIAPSEGRDLHTISCQGVGMKV
jgi:RNA 3'-terminal phosphate cyclase (ATP)